MEEAQQSYKGAIARVEQIVNIIENQEPDVDELTKLVKEATQLVDFCKKKLKSAENDLNSSLEKLD